METADYLRNFRDRWVTIVVVAGLGLLLAFGAGRAITPTYATTATMFLKVESTGASLFERSQFSLQRIKSYPDLVRSPELVSAVKSELGLSESTAELSTQLSAVNPANTVLLEITAESDDPEEAAAIANSAAAQLARLVGELENPSTSAPDDEAVSSSVELNLTLPAQAPLSPQSPNVPLIAGLGLLAGLALGMIFAILIERVRPLIRTAKDVRHHAGLPLVGQLSHSRARTRHNGETGRSPRAETALRETVSNVRGIFQGTFPAVIALAAVDSHVARSGTHTGIARVIAESGRGVILVEADAATTDPRLPVSESVRGLTDLLSGTVTNAAPLVAELDGEAFRVLPTGAPNLELTDFAVEQSVEGVFTGLTNSFDIVVVQVRSASHPLGIESLRPAVGGMFIVASYSRTTASALRGEVARIRSLGILPVGVILTEVPPRKMSSLIVDWHADDFINMIAAESEEPFTRRSVVPEVEVAPAPGPRLPRTRPPRRSADTFEPTSDGGDKVDQEQTAPTKAMKFEAPAAPGAKESNAPDVANSPQNNHSRADIGS